VTEQEKRRGEEVGFRGREGKSGKRVGGSGFPREGRQLATQTERERESPERELMRRERGERQLNEEREKKGAVDFLW
jgi:hypothetical protein